MPKKHTTSNKTRKRKGKDLDQIHKDLEPPKATKLLKQDFDLDLPECNRYFVDEPTLDKHKNTKVHKTRCRRLKEEPYSQKEADAAGGLDALKMPLLHTRWFGYITCLRKEIVRNCSTHSNKIENIEAKLRIVYEKAKKATKLQPIELSLKRIGTYGFDYDYTLAVYTKNLNELVYNLTMERMVKNLKYPHELLDIKYDLSFAIRGLHYDIDNGCLMKVDAYNQIQNGTVYRGNKKLGVEEVHSLYGGFSLPDDKGKRMPQLIDLFSLPWAGLLGTIVEYFDNQNIPFDPVALYSDVAECVRQVHMSGDMYEKIKKNLETYVHKNVGLEEFLNTLHGNGKELFVVTNSPYTFMNAGMTYMLGKDWRRFFKYIVVSARKPDFFQGNSPFRLYYDDTDHISYNKVSWFESNRVYVGGNIEEFSRKAEFKSPGVLYFGDHIYSDLADPMLKLGWHTAAIVPELAREIRIQNEDEYRWSIMWMDALTRLIEKHHHYGRDNKDAAIVINEWLNERRVLRETAKRMFNAQFGSIFRTFHSMSFFSRRLSRLSDIYTSRLPNLLKYDFEHVFYPRRSALPHEAVLTLPEYALELTKLEDTIQ